MKQFTEAYKRSEEMGKKTQQDMQSMKNEISNLRLAIRGETSEVFTPELEKTQVSPPKDQDAKGAEKEKEATKISSLVQRIKVRTEKRLRKGVKNLEYPFVNPSWKRKPEEIEEVDIIIHDCLDDLNSTERKLVSHRQHRKDYAGRHKIPDEDAKLIEDFLHNDIGPGIGPRDPAFTWAKSSSAAVPCCGVWLVRAWAGVGGGVGIHVCDDEGGVLPRRRTQASEAGWRAPWGFTGVGCSVGEEEARRTE
ncbi:hypothetical protein Taro_013705 [Colocasia esculenta]|uniref:Uncharacterized protein n=1 Tax=Colocasia esculenta TaxID=4460 RepID=A0A843UH67_COLES|nr:hypothetical protein [Colocasia esculenta]